MDMFGHFIVVPERVYVFFKRRNLRQFECVPPDKYRDVA